MAVFLGFVGLYLLVSWLVRRRSLGPSRPVVVRSDSTFQDGAPKRTPMGRMMASAGERPKVRHASEEQQPLEDAYAGEHMDEERELTSAEIEARDNAHAVQGQLSTLRFAPIVAAAAAAQRRNSSSTRSDAATTRPTPHRGGPTCWVATTISRGRQPRVRVELASGMMTTLALRGCPPSGRRVACRRTRRSS